MRGEPRRIRIMVGRMCSIKSDIPDRRPATCQQPPLSILEFRGQFTELQEFGGQLTELQLRKLSLDSPKEFRL